MYFTTTVLIFNSNLFFNLFLSARGSTQIQMLLCLFDEEGEGDGVGLDGFYRLMRDMCSLPPPPHTHAHAHTHAHTHAHRHRCVISLFFVPLSPLRRSPPCLPHASPSRLSALRLGIMVGFMKLGEKWADGEAGGWASGWAGRWACLSTANESEKRCFRPKFRVSKRQPRQTLSSGVEICRRVEGSLRRHRGPPLQTAKPALRTVESAVLLPRRPPLSRPDSPPRRPRRPLPIEGDPVVAAAGTAASPTRPRSARGSFIRRRRARRARTLSDSLHA